MHLSILDSLAALHGMIFGALFLLAFTGALVTLYGLRPEYVTAEGLKERMSKLGGWVWGMAAIAWATVITGSYFVYPAYRAKPPAGADLLQYPRSYLLSNPATAEWHSFGMEWKENVAWIAPIAATVVAFLITAYGAKLAKEPKIRRAAIWFLSLSFAAAGIAGIMGAFLTKVAPVH